MNIKYFTNAMLLIEGKNTKVLSDPWITFNNISNSNYYNFPENKFTQKQIKNIKPDYIYILAWQHQKTILKKYAHLRKKGIKFIIPLPKFKIL